VSGPKPRGPQTSHRSTASSPSGSHHYHRLFGAEAALAAGPKGDECHGLRDLADDWADLLDGSIDQSLLDAGAQAATNFWYSGSFSDGAASSYTCSGWTGGSALFDGRYGSTQQTSSFWIDTGEATYGLNACHVLCLAWR
jgi:hypothetical protein